MAWWNDILGLLREEVQALSADNPSGNNDLLTLKQAQALLKRTSRELETARARAEAARRRLLRAQHDMEALTREPAQHPRYRDRLIELSKMVAHESELSASFDAHIQRLDDIHQRIEAQQAKLGRDLRMAQAATAGSRTTRAVNPTGERAASGSRDPKREPGFRQQRSSTLMDQLRQGPRPAANPRGKSDGSEDES